MAELNFGLLNPPGSQSIGNAFVQGMDQAAVARAQENQNALSQYQLSAAKRTDQVQNAINNAYQNAINPDGSVNYSKVNAALAAGGAGAKIPEAEAARRKADLDAVELSIRKGTLGLQPTTLASAQVKLAEDKLKQSRSMLEGINPADSGAAQQYITWHEANHADPVLGPLLAARGVTMEQSRARIDKALQQPGGLAQLINESRVGTEEFTKQLLTQNKPPDVARLIEYRNSLPPGRDRDAVTDMIEKSSNENYQYNNNTGLFERRQGGGARAFVDPGIPQGVTPLLQASSVDEARRQAIAMNAAGLPVNIRGGGNALPGAQPQPAPVNNMPGAQPAAATTPLNPKQTQTQFETGEKIRGSESEALSKLAVDEYKQLGTAAASARKAMPGIDTAERILNAGFNTGWGTEAQAAAANILASLGVLDAKNYATNAQLFLAQARTVTNDRLLDQKGPQTDNDFKRTEETGARLGNTADANKFLLAVNRAINKQTIEKHNFFTKWVSKNDSLKGAEQAWQDSPAGSASLFDRPELKQYAQVKPTAATPTTTAKPAAPVKISGNAEYDKLPSGTLFIDPEGTQRRKP